jgi:hypothetical protein
MVYLTIVVLIILFFLSAVALLQTYLKSCGNVTTAMVDSF